MGLVYVYYKQVFNQSLSLQMAYFDTVVRDRLQFLKVHYVLNTSAKINMTKLQSRVYRKDNPLIYKHNKEISLRGLFVPRPHNK